MSHDFDTDGAFCTTEPTVFFLGAGFSRCVSEGKAPLMYDFFDQLKLDTYPQLHKFLVTEYGSPENANVEQALLLLEQLNELPLSGRALDLITNRDDPRILKRSLYRYSQQRLCNLGWSADHWAANLLACADNSTTVITTNYDTLAESILSHKVDAKHGTVDSNCFHCRMRALLLDDCQCDDAEVSITKPSWRGTVLKLHGSIAWQMCTNPSCRQRQCLTPDIHCRPVRNWCCSCCKSPTEPVIVLPSMLKSFADFPRLDRMWNAAADALQDCFAVVIWGFSLPASDFLIRRLFRNCITANAKLRHITIIDRNPSPVANAVREQIPPSRSIGIQTLLTPKDGSTPDWIVRHATHMRPTESHRN
jgi:NAD-dependent SIR2 family protein deacetylase